MSLAKYRQAGHLIGGGRTTKTQGWGDELNQWREGKNLRGEESYLEEPVVSGSSKLCNPLLDILSVPLWVTEWLDFMMLDFKCKSYLWCVCFMDVFFSFALGILRVLLLGILEV